MMEQKRRALPVGCRFRPTDFEITNYFLKRKALGQPMKTRTIPQECHDLFSRHPRDMPGDKREKHFYFFCQRRKDQVTYDLWTPIGEATNVLNPKNNDELVGIKRPFTLIDQEEESDDNIFLFDEEEFPKYNWFMDVFSLPPVTTLVSETDQTFEWVMCHVFSKKIKFQEEIEMPVIESESDSEEDESVVKLA